MRAVVDANVVAYLLLGTKPFADETRRFLKAVTDVFAPTVWEAELANIVWMAIRHGVVSEEDGLERLRLADGLGVRSVPTRTLWLGALVRSINSGLAVYNTLFVEVAYRERTPAGHIRQSLTEGFSEDRRTTS